MSNNSWSQAKIGEWGEKTFGRPANALSLVDRTKLEFDELFDLTHYMGDDEHMVREQRFVSVDDVMEEMADVVIILNQIAYYLSQDLDAAVAAKMIKNLKRKWVKTGDGVGRHI